MSEESKIIKEFTSKEYEHGWSVNFDADEAPIGINDDIIKFISISLFSIISSSAFFDSIVESLSTIIMDALSLNCKLSKDCTKFFVTSVFL